MIKKYLLFWSFLFLFILPLSSQSEILADFEKTKAKIKLEKSGEIFPIKEIKDKSFAFVHVKGMSYPECQRILNKYTRVVSYQVPEKYETLDIAPQVEKLKADYDYLIIAISLADLSGITKHLAFLRLLGQSEKSIILFFEDPSRPSPKLDALPSGIASIRAPQTKLGQSLAAQVLFGGISLNEDKAATRLGYVEPEIMEMNGQLMRDSIRKIVNEGLEAKAFPGAQVLVAYQGKVVFHEAFGYHTYEQERKVKTEDVYDLASVTKVSSALAALMKWHGEGKFDLDAPLSQYFTPFEKGNKKDLPFRQMLAHNAQLRPWIPYWKGTLKQHSKYPWQNNWDDERINDFRFKKKTFSREKSEDFNIYIAPDLYLHKDYYQQILKAIRKSPYNDKPGYVYSGLLFYLLPEIVGTMAEEDYETFLKETFYKPLGANTITYNPLRYIPDTMIIPTEKDTFFRMTQIHGYVHDEGAAMMGGVSANAGLFSSTNDLAKLFQMYMNAGEYGGERYIAAESVAEFSRCQYCDEGNRRGLGFDKPLIEYDAEASTVAKQSSPFSFGHSGYTGTFAWVDPDCELLFIFMSNRVYPTRNNRKLYTMGIRPRIHSSLYKAINVD